MNALLTNILLIGQQVGDYSFFPQALSEAKKADFKFHLDRSSTIPDAIQHLDKKDVNLILLDIPIQPFHGLDAFKQIFEHSPTVPIIIITDINDDEIALEAVRMGAQDYLIKSRINQTVILRVIRYALGRKKQEIEIKRKLDIALKEAQQAKQTAELKSKFLSYMSHEIRVPMNAVLGFSNLLKRTALNEKQRDYLETISSSGNLILNVINDILDLSKMESGHMIFETINFHLGRLVEDVFKIVNIMLEGKGLKLDYRISHEVPMFLQGDPYRIKQVLVNLLSNAIKFTQEGNISVSISLDSKVKGISSSSEGIVHFTVKDTGVGIPKDKQSVIFEAFTQADNSITRKYGGTGLGLAISKRLIDGMGGRIWVVSEENLGSEFHFTVKLKVADTDLDQTSADDIELSDYRKHEKLSLGNIKVLVAEDSAPSLELLREYFAIIGCSGDYVLNGNEALEKIKKNSYDLCLMDMEMPGLDGIEVTKKVRNEFKNNLPIIALTASAMKEDQDRCLEAGMNDYITKPIDMFLLKEKIIHYTQKQK